MLMMGDVEVVEDQGDCIPSNVCQCCLDSSGELKRMLERTTFKGIRDTYTNILYECLYIQISIPSSGPNDMLICAQCIDKLKEIKLFREQIQCSQRILKSKRQYQMSPTENVMVKSEVYNDENDRSIALHSDSDANDFHTENIVRRRRPTSDVVLQRALERTKRNLQLLKGRLSEESSETTKCIQYGDTLSLETRDSEPEDKIERRKYRWRKNYAKHIPFKLNKTDRTCKDCNETFPSHKGLLMHMPIHYPNHICNHCGRLFILKIHLERHVNYTHDTERVECPTCKKLVKKGSLSRHVRTHTENRYKVKCLYCPETFITHGSKMTHMRKEHDHQSEEYKCHICSKMFKVYSNLSTHIKSTHIGEKKHKCSECDKQFSNKYRLSLHMVKHTQERNFQCEVCHKRYGRKSTLREHMKIHNNMYNFVCSICNRAFIQKCTLQAHIKTHEK